MQFKIIGNPGKNRFWKWVSKIAQKKIKRDIKIKIARNIMMYTRLQDLGRELLGTGELVLDMS